MAPVPMVEIEHDNVSQGLDYFCSMFDGENPLLPGLFPTSSSPLCPLS